MLRDASAALSQVDIDELDPQEQVDHARAAGPGGADAVRADRDPRAEWNPLVHNPAALLHALISRPFAPPRSG